MMCNELIEIILATGRVAVLIIGMFAGIFSIYLGWRLYRDQVVSRVNAQIKWKDDFKLVFGAASPGIALALFGVWLLVTIVQQRVDLSEAVPNRNVQTTKPSTSQASLARRMEGQYSILPVQSTPSSSGGSNASNTTTKPVPDCTIRIKSRRLYSGDDDLSSADVRSALETSLIELERARQSEMDISRIKQLRRSISVIEQLQAGILP